MPTKDKIDQVLEGGSVAPWERDEDTTSVPDVATPQGVETGIIVDSPSGETALVTAENTQQGGMQFSEEMDFDLGELRIPYLKLLSGTSPEVSSGEGRAGQWFLQGHGAVDEVVFTVLGASRFRELREDISTPNARTLCRSNDGVIGVGAPGGVCKTCPYAQWGEKRADGKSVPPPCNAGFAYQIYSFTHGQPAILALRKSGIDAAKTINTALQLRKARNFISIMTHQDRPNPVNTRATYPAPYVVNRQITPEERQEVEAAAASLGL